MIADQISAILVQLRQECPAAHVLRLNVAVSALEAAALGKSKNSASGGSESEDIVLVVLAPHSGP